MEGAKNALFHRFSFSRLLGSFHPIYHKSKTGMVSPDWEIKERCKRIEENHNFIIVVGNMPKNHLKIVSVDLLIRAWRKDFFTKINSRGTTFIR